jgi:hypothetical protein
MKPSSCLLTYEVSQIAAWTALVVLAEVRHAPRYAQGSKTTSNFIHARSKNSTIFVQDRYSALIIMRIQPRERGSGPQESNVK